MSTLKVNNLQVGQDGTAANNYTLYQPASPDGTVRLGYGVAGSVTDILTLKNSRLGIGENNPVAKLHVLSGSGDQLWLDNAGERYTQISLRNNGTQKAALWLDETNNEFDLFAAAGYGIRFLADGTEKLRITSGGNIRVPDNGKFTAGAGDDLQIYHDGSINRIRSDVLTVIEKNDSEDMASFMPDGAVVLFHNGSQKFETTSTGAKVTGNFEPEADATRDLGSASLRWANIYSADLQLSNEGAANDVDGTWGQYTIQEGEDDLFLINRRNGKKYKFMLQEVN